MEPIRGTMVGRQVSPAKGRRNYDGERQLLAAIIVGAVAEAEDGDLEAAAWLNSTGRTWAEKLLGIEEPGNMRSIAEVRRELALPPVGTPARQAHEQQLWRERGARSRERQRERRGN